MASPTCSRQKKLERKRRKRKEKRKALRKQEPSSIDVPYPLDLPLMSETLMAFASPMLEKLEPNIDVTKVALMFAAAVWNAVAASDESSGDYIPKLKRELSEMKGAAAPDVDEIDKLVDKLVKRKQQEFADDPRGIIDLKVFESNGKIRVEAMSMVLNKPMGAVSENP